MNIITSLLFLYLSLSYSSKEEDKKEEDIIAQATTPHRPLQFSPSLYLSVSLQKG